MPYDTGCSEMEAKLNLSLISPIPLRPTITRGTANNKHIATMAESPRGQTSSAGLVSPPSQLGQSLHLNMQNDKMLISSMQRSEMSREIYHIIRYNLPTSISKTTTLPQLILVSRAIEKKLYQGASSYRNYIDESTLKLRITALACAVLIHSEEGASRGERSDTCLRLLAAARSSLPHCIMVLVSYETRQLDKRFANVASGNSLEANPGTGTPGLFRRTPGHCHGELARRPMAREL
eukprot:CCRYP_019392-RA/>CCRYP_019392-RA protein AED:0.10 eAED:0.10 QI:416/1/1/1/0.5/0.33/3/548/235